MSVTLVKAILENVTRLYCHNKQVMFLPVEFDFIIQTSDFIACSDVSTCDL